MTRPRRSPPFWLGCDLPGLLGLWKSGGFHADAARAVWIPVALVTAGLSSLLRGYQRVRYRRRLQPRTVAGDPVFVLGHWRSGTTLVHELLAADPQFTAPTTYACLCPHHFVVSERFAKPLLRFLIPGRRPMDAMPMGWERPQEDEFAQLVRGLPTPYRFLVFPDRFPPAPVPEDPAWWTALETFWSEVLVANPGRLVVKSPPHTFRLAALAARYPEARFLHVVRDPLEVFPSTLHLWRTLLRDHALRRPRELDLEETVLATFEAMYARFESDRERLPPDRVHDLRYDDLLSDPLGSLESAYRALELGPFQPAVPGIRRYLELTAGHERNRFDLDADQRRQVEERWRPWMRRYGYAGAPIPEATADV